LELFTKLRSGKKDYDFSARKKIGGGGFAEVYEVKSNVD
jgi:hypothetical protein